MLQSAGDGRIEVLETSLKKRQDLLTEQGGDPASVKFCHRTGLTYVSCSPFRLPIARLAAAQAAIEESGDLELEK